MEMSESLKKAIAEVKNRTPEDRAENDRKIAEFMGKAEERHAEIMKRSLKFGFHQYYIDSNYFPIIEIGYDNYYGDREFRIALLGLSVCFRWEPTWE